MPRTHDRSAKPNVYCRLPADRSGNSRMNSPQPYLTVASILTGFSISVFMFRIQRELGVRDRHPDWPNWLAWADYLIMATIMLSVGLVILPLMSVPAPSRVVYSIAAASCAAASI